MIKTQILCDICERPLQVIGNSYYKYSTKECNTSEVFPHLCKSCADKLDIAFRHMRAETKKQAELAEKFAKVNKERKEKLGSEG